MADDTPERADALAEIAELARHHGLTGGEIARYLADEEAAAPHRGETLTRLLAYLGGLLIFSALVAYAGMRWEDMGSAERITLTLGPGIVAYVLACVSLRDPSYSRAATPLFLLAGLMQPAGLLVAFAEYAAGGDERIALLIVSSVLIVSFGLTFWKEQRSALLFLVLVYAATCLAVSFDWLDLSPRWNGLMVGLFLLSVSHGISRTRHAAIAGFWYFIGSAVFLTASWEILTDGPLDVLFVGLGGFLMYLSLVVRSRALLLNGTLGVLFFIGYYTNAYFADAGGWPLVLLLLGLALIGLSKFALDLEQKYIRQA